MIGKLGYLLRRIGAFYAGNARTQGMAGVARVTWGLALLASKPLSSRIGGEDRHCPCCGWRGRRFMPFLALQHFLFDYSCPRCGSAPRHRGQRLFYEQVLGFGARRGSLLYFAPEHNVEYFRSITALEVKTSNYPIGSADYCIDILDIPFADASWDYIVCNHVIEHLSDDRKGMREFLRILKPRGMAIISVPMADRDITLEYGGPNPMDHEHYYSYGRDFARRIPEEFRVTAHRFADFCSPAQRREMNVHEDVVYVLEKAAV